MMVMNESYKKSVFDLANKLSYFFSADDEGINVEIP